MMTKVRLFFNNARVKKQENKVEVVILLIFTPIEVLKKLW